MTLTLSLSLSLSPSLLLSLTHTHVHTYMSFPSPSSSPLSTTFFYCSIECVAKARHKCNMDGKEKTGGSEASALSMGIAVCDSRYILFDGQYIDATFPVFVDRYDTKAVAKSMGNLR